MDHRGTAGLEKGVICHPSLTMCLLPAQHHWNTGEYCHLMPW